MQNPGRKLAFVLASTSHGTMIVNRLDQHMVDATRGFGVGLQLLETAAFDPNEVNLALQIINLRRKHHGDGVVALDCGANIGVHTIEWAAAMNGWGSVIAVEAQERVYYALAGNIAINNCFNAIAINAAVSSQAGTLKIPQPDYLQPSSFGSLELRKRENTEFIGQPIDYSADKMVDIRMLALDDFALPRVDFIKIDVEGMELEVLDGAKTILANSRPIMLIESIKTDAAALREQLGQLGYELMTAGINILAIHRNDPTLSEIKR